MRKSEKRKGRRREKDSTVKRGKVGRSRAFFLSFLLRGSIAEVKIEIRREKI